MLRLSRFRGRRGVLGSRGIEVWNGCGNVVVQEEVCGGWNDDVGMHRREFSMFACESDWQTRCESSDMQSWRMGRRGSCFGYLGVQSRGYAGEPGFDDDGGRDERETILDVIEQDMRIQDDVAMYLYSKTREKDPKTLLGAMYIKAGFEPPLYSVQPGFKGKFVGTVVVKGRRFTGFPSESEEEAEKSAADGALSWVLGQPRQGAGTERGRGRGTGMMRGVGRGGRGRGRGRGGSNVKRRGVSGLPTNRVPIKPRQCFHVEINYKLMKFVVLYEQPEELYYPYKEFPTHRFIEPYIGEKKPKKEKKPDDQAEAAEAA